MIVKYDDASWHYGGDFPNDLPDEAGATHMAMFAVWAWVNGLAGALIANESPGCLESVRGRTETPGTIFLRWSDGKLVDEDLNSDGNKFAVAYYGKAGKLKDYLRDYDAALGADLPTTYHVPDSWETFDKIAPIISNRFDRWRKK